MFGVNVIRSCRCILNNTRSFNTLQRLNYKSPYNISELYPGSDSKTAFKRPYSPDSSSEFSGHIPLDQVRIKYSKSGGPGGQHVNKVNTKVEVRFHVPSAEWLSERVRNNLLEQEAGRITKDGYIILTSEKTRKQILNQADALDKIRDILWQAAKVEYQPSIEEQQLLQQRREAARRGILREKRVHSQKKQARQKPSVHS